MRIVCDTKKCTGCLACVVTCLDHHDFTGEVDSVSRRRYWKFMWPSGYTHYITDSCHHCANAPCVQKCPVHAIFYEGNGWTAVDQSLCVGCRLCSKVCPFDIPQFGVDRKMLKCDGCGGDPNCIKICPNGALAVQE